MYCEFSEIYLDNLNSVSFPERMKSIESNISFSVFLHFYQKEVKQILKFRKKLKNNY